MKDEIRPRCQTVALLLVCSGEILCCASSVAQDRSDLGAGTKRKKRYIGYT